jgi:FAD/FMN-containing dehydrogenase
MPPITEIATGAASLRSLVAGTVVLPGEAGWDEARQAWNLAVDQRPAMVALPVSAADVQAIVDHARAAGLRVAMQGTGHNAAPLGDLSDTILVKTHRMRGVQMDAEHRIARVEAGVLWAEVTGPAAEVGLAPLAGSSPDVGVVGYSLGGGASWLARRYGLAAERILAIDVVTADGRLVRTDRHTEPDLFWALRGGGGSFAAVVAMEFELIPLRQVYAGMLAFPWERAREVLHAWREWTATAPDTVTTSARIMQVPPLPDVPEFLRGRGLVVIDGAALGDEASARAVLEPLRALGPEIDTWAMMSPAGLSHVHMDPEHPVPGMGDSALVDELPAEAIDALVDRAGAGAGSPLLAVELRHLGGAVGRRGSGALGRLDAAYALFAVGIPMVPELVPAIEAHLALVKAAVAPYGRGREYLNFAERATDPAAFFGADAYARLRRIKGEVDPGDLFRANHPIPAA